MPSKYILLFPEDLPASFEIDHAVYAKVASETATHAMVEERGKVNAPLMRVPQGIVTQRRVTAAEYRRGTPGTLVRQAVAGIHDGSVFHGQVLDYQGMSLSIRCGSRVLEVDASHAREVAPVLCLLLQKVPFPKSTTVAALADMHHAILDRLLGENDAAATRDIPNLLRGFVTKSRQPADYDTIEWIHPTTGKSVTVSIRHAIDFGFSVDGGHRLSEDEAALVGQSFCDDPRFSDEPAVTSRPGPSVPNARLNALLQQLSDSEESDGEAPATRQQPRSAPAPAARSSAPASGVDAQVEIITRLASNPTLLRTYIASLLPTNSATTRRRDDITASEDDEDGDIRGLPRARRLESISDLLVGGETAHRRESHSFRPSAIQRRIHDTITSPDHRGKSPTAFMDYVLSSSATKFMPHPAILSRLYAFEFGVYGLSVRHFVRASHRSRRDWYNNSTINLHNYSPSVERPTPTRFSTVQALSDALAVLGVFAEEFFDRVTRRFVATAREFVEDLRTLNTFESDDIQTIAHWFDCIFEEYRRAVEVDARAGSNTRVTVTAKFNMQEPSLQAALFVIQDERITAVREATRITAPPRRHVPAPRGTASGDERAPRALLPDDVFKAIPRHGTKQVCLRFLSSRGCPSSHPDRCINPNAYTSRNPISRRSFAST